MNGNKRFIIGLMVLVVLACAGTAESQIGFQASFDRPLDTVQVVSSYDEPVYEFSAAMRPQTRVPLSRQLRFSPQVVGYSADSSSLRFNTSFHGNKNLVPVSVDARSFFEYRSRIKQKQKFMSLSNQAILRQGQGQKRQGLNIGFQSLPKRFDKIFGEGGANLKITGYRRITFSGRSQWQDGAESDLIRQNKFPSLNMEQISRFDITGTIGSKITVSVSQDNQTDIPLANRLQIRYKGDDDDILKSVEAGNTNLSLPNTRFVGYSSRIQGLFGIKAEAQVGNLTLTGIASQEKGSTEKASIDAAGEANATILRDKDYQTSRIYDLGYDGEFGPFDKVTSLYVYEFEKQSRVPEARDALLLIDPTLPETDPVNSPYSENQTMVQLEDNLYSWYDDAARNLHYIYFNTRRSDSKARAVSMIIERFTSPGVPNAANPVDTIGNITSDTLVLKTIHAGTSYDPQHPTWSLMWRNIYSIPKGVDIGDLDLKVFEGLEGREGTNSSFETQIRDGVSDGYFLEILGLDQYNKSQKKVPDNLLDDRIEVFRSDWGLLIFPNREPFNDTTTFELDNGRTRPLTELVPTLYNYTSSTERLKNSKYYIQYVTRERSSIIRLDRVNIIEGSEVVTVNGRQLARGTDYNIQYDFGQITLLSDEATDPNADVSIDYEYAPFLAVQKKTLFGLRGEYEWSKNLKFGSTVLYKSDKAQDRKPRVGQETAKMLVLDFNVDFKIYPNFMTKAVNALPMVNTTQESQLAVSAEVAQSRPNPNVDNVAYIDDFEAALDRLNLGNSRTQWTKASAPVQIEGLNYQRGKMLWHRPYYSVAKEDVYDVTAAQGEGSISTLRLIYRPNPDEISTTITADTTFEIEVDTTVVDTGSVVDTSYDTTTTVTEIDTTSLQVDTAKVDSWAGIMRAFDGRVDSERAQLFEIRCRGGSVGGASSTANLHGKVHLDFGRITEDVNGDGISFNEDKPPWGNEDFSVDSLEDVGLDGLADQQEPGYDPVNNPDPDDDNWFFLGEGKCPVSLSECNSSTFLDRVENPDDPYYYEWLNGTEGNRRDLAVVGIPDNEELTGSFSEQDQYFSFVLDLDNYPDSFLVEGSERNGWVTYRIPIRDTLALDTVVGSDARWNQIQHIRIWYESDLTDSEEDTLEIADWYFVQSNWQDSLVLNEDLTLPGEPNFVVASVSTDDGTFDPPPNVEAYQDPQAGNIEEAQRGLALAYTDLRPGDTAIASRYLLTTEAYSGYRTLEMYVHGDEGLSAAGGDSIGFFFRLGNDSVNFYEYHTETRMYPGWDERNYVKIDFNEITALKDAALNNLATGQTVDTSDATYRIKGNPNINQVRYFATGVVNLDSTRTATSTGVVWVDELRVTEVRRDVGTAARVSFNGNGGDLFTYNFSYQATDPYFRGISTATRGGSSNNLGSGETVKNLVYGASLNIDRFLPRSWGARLPISFSYSKTTKIPLLRNNSDIVLPEDRRIEEKSISESKSFRISESFGKKGRNPLFNVLLNRQTVSFSYSRSTSSSVNRPFYLGENYNVTTSFQAGITKPPTIPIFYIAKFIPILKKTAGSQLSLYPKVWRWQGTLNRNLSISEDADARRVSSLKKEFTGNMNMTYQVLNNLNTTFRYDTRRDLTDPDNVNLVFNAKDFKLGLETSYSQSFSGDYDPRLFGFLTMKWNYSVSYKDSYEQTTATRKSDMSRTWNVGGQFKHMDLLSLGSGGGGSGSRGRGRRRPKKVDRPFYDPPLAVLRFLTGWIDPFTYKYGQSFSNSLPGMTERPSLGYRFGLSDSAEVDIVTTTRTQSAGEGETVELGSGFDVFGGISTDVRYKRGVDRDLIRTGKLNESRSTKWPDLTIRISQFKSFPLIKGVLNRFISVFSPRTGYNRDVREDFSLTDGFQTNKTVTISYNPLLSVTFRVFRSLSLSGSYTKSNSEVTKFNLQTGDTDNETRTEKKTMAFSSKYQFSAPSGIALPLFGKLKFRSTVSIDLNVRYSNNKAENAKLGNPFVLTTDQSDMTVSPVISYTFSQQIKGGLSAKWQDSNDSKLNKKSHVRELQIWAEIRF